jgi:putative tricarboxylic transport membrane protein
MITLGIPGSPTAAVMLGGLLIWGLQPGPMLFKEQPDFVIGPAAEPHHVPGLTVDLLRQPHFGCAGLPVRLAVLVAGPPAPAAEMVA